MQPSCEKTIERALQYNLFSTFLRVSWVHCFLSSLIVVVLQIASIVGGRAPRMFTAGRRHARPQYAVTVAYCTRALTRNQQLILMVFTVVKSNTAFTCTSHYILVEYWTTLKRNVFIVNSNRLCNQNSLVLAVKRSSPRAGIRSVYVKHFYMYMYFCMTGPKSANVYKLLYYVYEVLTCPLQLFLYVYFGWHFI